MTENVENVEITWDEGAIYLSFRDLFGEGEQYGFKPAEAVKIRDWLTEAIRRQAEP